MDDHIKANIGKMLAFLGKDRLVISATKDEYPLGYDNKGYPTRSDHNWEVHLVKKTFSSNASFKFCAFQEDYHKGLTNWWETEFDQHPVPFSVLLRMELVLYPSCKEKALADDLRRKEDLLAKELLWAHAKIRPPYDNDR